MLLTTFNYEATILACAQGQRPALRALYAQESPRLLAVVLRIVQNRALAEDIVHDAFIKIWTQAAQYQPELGAARGWIYTITRNLALNALQYSQRQIGVDTSELIDLADRLVEHDGATNTDTHHGQDSERLHGCLEQLEPQPKQCLLYAYVEGYTQNEIAQRLNQPLGTVKSWVKRSLQRLKECMQ